MRAEEDMADVVVESDYGAPDFKLQPRSKSIDKPPSAMKRKIDRTLPGLGGVTKADI